MDIQNILQQPCREWIHFTPQSAPCSIGSIISRRLHSTPIFTDRRHIAIQNALQQSNVIQTIAEQYNPSIITGNNLKSSGRDLLCMSLVSHSFYINSNKQLSRLKNTYRLYVKYRAYNAKYEFPSGLYNYTAEHYNIVYPGGNPQLLDALFSGYSLFNCEIKPSFPIFTKETEADIREIVRLTPQSLTCNIGRMGQRLFVTPLYAACVNEHVPIHIIEFLLANGAEINTQIFLLTHLRPIIHDVESLASDKERLAEIKKVFARYATNQHTISR